MRCVSPLARSMLQRLRYVPVFAVLTRNHHRMQPKKNCAAESAAVISVL